MTRMLMGVWLFFMDLPLSLCFMYCTKRKILHVRLKLTPPFLPSKWKGTMHDAAVRLWIQLPQLLSTPPARLWGAVQLSTAASLPSVLQVRQPFQQKDCQSQGFYLPRSPLWAAEKLCHSWLVWHTGFCISVHLRNPLDRLTSTFKWVLILG